MPVDIAQTKNYCIENVRFFNSSNYLNKQTGFAFLLEESSFWNEYIQSQNELRATENDKLIKLESQILKQLDSLNKYYEEIDIEFFRREHLRVSADILQYNPDNISTQLTYDKSIFAIFTKDDSVYHIDYYLESSDDNEDVVLAITDKNKNIKSFAGSYNYIKSKLEEIIPIQNSNTSLELVLNELSN